MKHSVKQGDCILNIAEQHGMSWGKVWQLPENTELRNVRKDPTVLYPGDVVQVQEKDIREENRSTDKRHRFEKNRNAAKVRIRFLLDDEPRWRLPFTLIVNGKEIHGQTDGKGLLEADIPPDAGTGLLRIGKAGEEIQLPITFGSLDPIDTDSGLRQRLLMLGFPENNGIKAAVKAFQEKYGLSATGNADEETRQKLKIEFGQ
jgi:hypothetical protein